MVYTAKLVDIAICLLGLAVMVEKTPKPLNFFVAQGGRKMKLFDYIQKFGSEIVSERIACAVCEKTDARVDLDPLAALVVVMDPDNLGTGDAREILLCRKHAEVLVSRVEATGGQIWDMKKALIRVRELGYISDAVKAARPTLAGKGYTNAELVRLPLDQLTPAMGADRLEKWFRLAPTFFPALTAYRTVKEQMRSAQDSGSGFVAGSDWFADFERLPGWNDYVVNQSRFLRECGVQEPRITKLVPPRLEAEEAYAVNIRRGPNDFVTVIMPRAEALALLRLEFAAAKEFAATQKARFPDFVDRTGTFDDFVKRNLHRLSAQVAFVKAAAAKEAAAKKKSEAECRTAVGTLFGFDLEPSGHVTVIRKDGRDPGRRGRPERRGH